MASCGFAQLVGGACGSSADNPANVKCVAVGICKKDIQGHLGNNRVIGDSLLDCEAKLILARAGKAALGMFCIFIYNLVTIIVIVKFICGLRYKQHTKCI